MRFNDERGAIDPNLLREFIQYNAVDGSMFWRPRTADMFYQSSRPEGDAIRFNKQFAGKPLSIGVVKQKGGAKTPGVSSAYVWGIRFNVPKMIMAIHFGRYPEKMRFTFADSDQFNTSLANIVPLSYELKMTPMKRKMRESCLTTGNHWKIQPMH